MTRPVILDDAWQAKRIAVKAYRKKYGNKNYDLPEPYVPCTCIKTDTCVIHADVEAERERREQANADRRAARNAA